MFCSYYIYTRSADFSFNWTKGRTFHLACQNQNQEIKDALREKFTYRLLYLFFVNEALLYGFLNLYEQNKMN